MSLLAVSTAGAILAILALVVGLVVLGVVIILLQGVLSPAREIAQQAKQAPDVAPFLTNGVQGVDELSRTRQLTNQVPPLALAYLEKVQSGAPAPGPPAPGGAPAGQGAAPSEPPHYGSVHRGGISGGKQ
jgi:hypothetical protein